MCGYRLKDCDVTWLYGPLQTGSNRVWQTQPELSSSSLPKVDSSISLSRPPILKKRNVSKLMSRNITTRYPVRKHIHFDKRVQQCISVDAKSDNAHAIGKNQREDSSDSDDGVIMRRVRPQRRGLLTRRIPEVAPQASSKAIAALPSMALKCRTNEPEPGMATKHSIGACGCLTSSISSSQSPHRCLKQCSNCSLSEKQDGIGRRR